MGEDDYSDDDARGSRKASFNMAVATLGRLDGILRRMEFISEVFSGLNEQKRQLKLVRHFCSNASPLLAQIDEKDATDFKNKVYSLRLSSRMFKGKRFEVYNPKLDNEIMDLVTDIQIKLKSHFMPASGDDDDEDDV